MKITSKGQVTIPQDLRERIGAHAATESMALLTRDVSRYRTYFPTVQLIVPNS
jgi:bifunctional DNA-binding transcriptional regulator/antitoxin component of YhaV-PrlF toxin-antitoxin module